MHVYLIDSSRHADEIPNGPRKLSGPLRKTIPKECGILMPLHKVFFTKEHHKDLLAKTVNPFKSVKRIFPNGFSLCEKQ